MIHDASVIERHYSMALLAVKNRKNHVSAWSGGEASDRRERSERGRRGLPSHGRHDPSEARGTPKGIRNLSVKYFSAVDFYNFFFCVQKNIH